MNAYIDYDSGDEGATVYWTVREDRTFEYEAKTLAKAVAVACSDDYTSRIVIVIYAPEVLA